LEKVEGKIDMDQEGFRLGAKIGLLAYVDDIVLLAENQEQLIRQSTKLSLENV